MKSRAPFTGSFRGKFCFGIATILLPLLIFAGATFYALNDISVSFSQITDEVTEEIPPVSQLKTLVLLSQMPPNDYLINHNPKEKENFNFFAAQIDRNLTRLKKTSFDDQEERAFLVQTLKSWEESKLLAAKLFAIDRPSENPETNLLMKEFDARVSLCASTLDQLEQFAFHEIKGEQKNAQANSDRILIYLGVTLAIGLLFALLTGLLLARAVFTPLNLLRQGAINIAEGTFEQLKYSGRNEFGPVIDTFNDMALSLQKSQAKLEDLAMRDGLTGLLNRREFQRLLAQELDRAQRSDSSMSMILLDIDHFKRVNDTYGHQVGDEVLRSVSSVLTGQIRTMDHVARYGGEEFVVVTPNDGPTALGIAERIRRAVENTPHVDSDQTPFRVTVSLGIASFPECALELDALVGRADEALYRAKRSGRNRSCISEPSEAGDPLPQVS